MKKHTGKLASPSGSWVSHGCERPTNGVVAEGTIPAGTLSAQIEGVVRYTPSNRFPAMNVATTAMRSTPPPTGGKNSTKASSGYRSASPTPDTGRWRIPPAESVIRPWGGGGLAVPGRLVHLYVAFGRLPAIEHERPYPLHHLVCLLVGNADLALHLLSRDRATSASHQVYGVEPQVQRGRYAKKDRALLRMDVQPAGVAGVGRPGFGPVELSFPLAAWGRTSGGRPVRSGRATDGSKQAASSGNSRMNSSEREVRFGR